jgi:WD40 repeat protein
MLVLQTDLRDPDRLMFSPDGQALLATEDSRVQLWPRWLDAHPNPPRKVQTTLERCALDPDASRVYLYVSGNSSTRVLDLKSGREAATRLPSGGPSWFHFDTAGGLFLVSHGYGKLTRFDLAPKARTGFRKRWAIERPYAGSGTSEGGDGGSSSPRTPLDGPTTLGSHYRFGAICAPAGVFAALEYRYDRHEPFDGLVVRSVTDGALLYREVFSAEEGRALKDNAGLTLSIHPSGQYFAYPHENRVRFQALANVRAPKELAPVAHCRAVAFHPSGALLAAVGSSGTVTLYDTATWGIAREFAWDIGPLRAVCFSPDGARAATIAMGESTGVGKRVAGRAIVWDMDL